ncbi:MAG: MlaD family protein [Gemmatimonadota bacterium]|nr:MlaD family protein [Gemmatimonadota bacterium]
MKRSEMITHDALRVAAFAIVALGILTYAVIRLGTAAHLFSKRYSLYAFVQNASGLREGGQVTVAGQLAGSIKKIEFLPVSNDTTRHLRITVQLDESMQPQVRRDSRVMLRNQGLLGDRFFDITPGTPRFASLTNGDTLVLGPSVDYDVMIQRAAGVLTDVAGLTHELRAITESVAHGDGTVGKLLTDRGLYDRLNSTLASTSSLLTRLQNPNGSVGRMLDDPQLYNSLTQMVTQVDSLMTQLNSGKGSAGKLLRDDSLYSNLVKVTAHADTLVGSLSKGNGTASKLLSDTTLYNQMVQAVAHLNEILADVRKNPKRYTKGAITIF